MPSTPSIVKGQELPTGPRLTTHVVVIVQQPRSEELLQVAKSWISAGVLEPVLWVPSGWLTPSPTDTHGPRCIAFGRAGDEPERREVLLLEALSREPHDQIVLTVINAPGDLDRSDPGDPDLPGPDLPGQIERLIQLLDKTMPRERLIDDRPSRSTKLRVLSLHFPAADKDVPTGVGKGLLTSNTVKIETLIVNPEDRPTPISVDVIAPEASHRWPQYVLSNTASLAGFWSSLATSPVEPDAEWRDGNVRVVRTNARVVLTHPLMAWIARNVRTTLEAPAAPGAVREWKALPARLSPLGPADLTLRITQYVDSLMATSGLGFREPPLADGAVPRTMGLWASIRALFAFVGDKLAALPRWMGASIVRTFNRAAASKVFGREPKVEIDVRIDFNLRRDDPKLIDAWDFVEAQRRVLAEALAGPTEQPRESDDPGPWLAIHQGVALFVEGQDNAAFPALRDGDRILVAASLDDVVPPPNDRFTVPGDCDQLLGGDGSGRVLGWEDIEAARRLEGRLSQLVIQHRDRALYLRSEFLSAEKEFFDAQDRYVGSRFEAEDALSRATDELRIAQVDGVEPGSPRPPLAAAVPDPDPARTDDTGGDPFVSPLDDKIATPLDLQALNAAGDRARQAAERARRLRGALSDVALSAAERLCTAEADLRTLERAHGDLNRWIQSRSSSFAGQVLRKVSETASDLDRREAEVYAIAGQSPPDFGIRAAELQQQFVKRVRTGLLLTIGLTAILWGLSSILAAFSVPPGFTGIPWWVYVLILVVGCLASVFGPMLPYFQDWTRERLAAEDESDRLTSLVYLVRHIRTERVRLARLHMQVPQRLRALSLWWHYWDVEGRGAPAPATPPLPDCSDLPHHLRWAEVDALSSPRMRELMERLLVTRLQPGYRSELLRHGIDAHVGMSSKADLLSPEGLAALRAGDALQFIEAWVADDDSRVQAAAQLEREFADRAQNDFRASGSASPPVGVLNVDPLAHLVVETDLLEDPRPPRPSVDEFLLEVGVDAAHMTSHVWGAAVGVQPFKSHFAGPGRLRERLAPSVNFVAAEGSKLCSSEVAIRIDITDQVQVDMVRP